MGFLKKMWELNKEINAASKEVTVSKEIIHPTIQIEYIGGHPKLKGGKNIKIRKGNRSGKLVISSGFETINCTLVDYSWGEQGKRSVGKAAAGAIVGGVLTGGVGAIAGAALGAKKKDNSILTLGIEQDGRHFNIQLRANQSKYNDFAKKVL